MLFDRSYPSLGNFDFTISIDVVRMKSYTCYMDGLLDPTCVLLRVLRSFAHKQAVYLCRVLLSSLSSVSVSPIYTLLHSHGVAINNSKRFHRETNE